jgi:hypothetical protein
MVDLDRWGGVADEPSSSALPVAETTAREDLTTRVLVIDDDQEIHRLLRARLEARGYSVADAESGEEGIAKLREVHPDLVFLEVAMSGPRFHPFPAARCRRYPDHRLQFGTGGHRRAPSRRR